MIKFDKFKKLSSDGKSTTLLHPEGHKVVIAHKALSPGLRKQLDKIPKNYADGGEVEGDRSPASTKEERRAAAAIQSGLAEKRKSGETVLSFKGEPLDYNEMQQYPVPASQMSGAPDSYAGDLDAEDLALIAGGMPKVDDGSRPVAGGMPKVDDGSRPDLMTTNTDDGQGGTISAGAVQGSPQVSPDKGFQQVPNDPFGRETVLQNTMAGIQGQELAIQQQAAIEKAHHRIASSKVLAQFHAIKEVGDNFQNLSNNYIKNQESLLKDYDKGHINPNHFTENLGSWGRARSAIALFLGGMGGGLTHQGNPALDFLNKQIDRDVDAQKANKDKQRNLFTANLQLYQNEKDAYLATKDNITELYSHVAKELANHTGGQLAQTRANLLSSSLKQQVAPQVGAMIQQQAIMKALSDGQGSGIPGGAPKMAPEMKIRLMQAGGFMNEAQYKQATEELGKAKEFEAIRNQALAGFDIVANAATLSNKLGDPRQTISGTKAAQLNASISMLARDASGKFSEYENELMQKQFVPKLTDKPSDVAMKRQAFQNYINSKGQFPTLSQFAIDIPGTGRYNMSGEKKFELMPPVKQPKK